MTYKYNTNPNPLPTGIRFGFDCFGGDEGDRTLDLLNAIQTRSQTKRLRTPVKSSLKCAQYETKTNFMQY